MRVLVALVITFATIDASSAQPRVPEAQVTESLFQDYIANQYRIETDQVRAAVVLVANRGLDNPELVNRILQEFETVCAEKVDRNRKVKVRTLAVLSRMLEISGRRRGSRKRLGGMVIPPNEWPHETEILRKVIACGREATRSDIDEFAIAIRNARHPEGEQFLLDVLSNPASNETSSGDDPKGGRWPDNTGGNWMPAKFVAAVGLAELGNPVGVEWLLARAKPNHLDHRQDLYFKHKSGQHFYAQSGRLGENCIKSLADLAQMNSADVDDVQPLNDWWKMHKEQFTGGSVDLQFEPGGSLN